MFETILLVSFTILTSILGVYITTLLIKLKHMRASVDQLHIHLGQVLEELQSSIEREEKTRMESSDGFVKFLSDSREWAFSFIEEVQIDLVTLFDKLDSGTSSADDIIALKKYLPEKKQ